eukprot:11188431-Lingulodinium_polyedra.AAC.1
MLSSAASSSPVSPCGPRRPSMRSCRACGRSSGHHGEGPRLRRRRRRCERSEKRLDLTASKLKPVPQDFDTSSVSSDSETRGFHTPRLEFPYGSVSCCIVSSKLFLAMVPNVQWGHLLGGAG